MMRILLLCLAMLIAGSGARADDFVTENFRIPMRGAEPDGLETVLVKPSRPGRHPLVLLSHGSPRDGDARPGMTARGMMPQMIAFAERGFVAVSVLRRGYGTSSGGWAESFGPCDHADYTKAGLAGAADLRAALKVLSRRPDVDPKKILAVGVSAGGFATTALTVDPPPGLIAAINFAGGRGSSGPDQVCRADALVEAFKAYGEKSRTPMVWVYAENDHFFGPALAQRLFKAFESGGGRASFMQAKAFGDDGHKLFSAGGRDIWVPIVEQFVKARGFVLEPEAKPAVALEPPPDFKARARQDFQTFLAAASHKAFAVSESGAYAWRTGRNTTAEASETALRNCEQMAHKPCRLYAIDDAYAPKS